MMLSCLEPKNFDGFLDTETFSQLQGHLLTVIAPTLLQLLKHGPDFIFFGAALLMSPAALGTLTLLVPLTQFLKARNAVFQNYVHLDSTSRFAYLFKTISLLSVLNFLIWQMIAYFDVMPKLTSHYEVKDHIRSCWQ